MTADVVIGLATLRDIAIDWPLLPLEQGLIYSGVINGFAAAPS